MLFPHSLHTLDSTKKVSDVLKLFEDGEMAEYLQGDVSGSWEILSFTNSSPPPMFVFTTPLGSPTSRDYSGPTPCSPPSRHPSVHHYCSYCFRTKQESLLIQDSAQETILLPWMLPSSALTASVPTTPNSSIPSSHPADYPMVMLALIIGHWV